MKLFPNISRIVASSWIVVWLALLAATASAQNLPRIGYVYPAGSRPGATVQITLGGQFLDGATNVGCSCAGLEAKVLEHTKPLTQQQINALREELQNLQEQRAAAKNSEQAPINAVPTATNATQAITWTPADERRMEEIRELLKNAPKRQANPAIGELVSVQIKVPRAAVPGTYELRLGTAAGYTNPLLFEIGELTEIQEQEPTNANQPNRGKAAGVAPKNSRKFISPSPKGPDQVITLPATINGRILPGDVDRFRFNAHAGQQVIVAVSARRLIPYLPDAVPGWFQAAVTLYDSNGKELAYADDFRFEPDPVLAYKIPRPGEYILEIKDALYRGREDFVYRIALGELPYLTGIFPLGGPAGTPIALQLDGWNLPTNQLVLQPESSNRSVSSVSLSLAKISNRLPFAWSTLPECLEQEPNQAAGSEQAITIPVIVNGRIDSPDDRDCFRFAGQAGAEIVAEIQARRLQSPLDSRLILTDANGRQLAFNDDFEDRGAGWLTHQADSRLRFILPEAGTYHLRVEDTQRQGGPEYGYRLRLSLPRPDFELRVVPSTINARAGATAPLTVYALRQDGFTNEIRLRMSGAPKGATISGGRVPANQDQVRVTLTLPRGLKPQVMNLELEGRAELNGRAMVRQAVPAEDMMQAFSYRHLVPAQTLLLACLGPGRMRGSVNIADPLPLKIPSGGMARMRFTTTWPAGNPVQLELSEPPAGITLEKVAWSTNGTELDLRCDAAKAKPGLAGNLIVTAMIEQGGGKNRAKPRRSPLGFLPAIPFEVVPQVSARTARGKG